MFQETFIVQWPDLSPLWMYAFVHVYTILTLGRSINLCMQGFPRRKHMIFCMAIFPYMNIQDVAKGLLTSVLQSTCIQTVHIWVWRDARWLCCISVASDGNNLTKLASRLVATITRNLFMPWWDVWQFFLWSYSLETNFLIM